MALNRQAVFAAIDACSPEDEVTFARGRKVFEAGGSLADILDASAPDAQSWHIGETVYRVVCDVLDNQPSLIQRLTRRSPRPYEGRVPVSKATALHCALDAAAPDQESWVRGEAAFFIEGDIDPALDTCAPDKEAWVLGDRIFLAVFFVLEGEGFTSVKRLFRDDQFAPAQLAR